VRVTTLLVPALIAVSVTAIASEQEARELFGQARTANEARDFSRAADLFERSDLLFPQVAAAYNAAVCYVYAGSCDAARRAVERLIDRTAELRDNAAVSQARAALLGQQETPEGGRCALVNRLLRSVDEVLGIEHTASTSETDARNFASQAQRYYEAEDFARAAILYETAHATYPMLVDALFNAGMAYHLAGQHAEALAAFVRVVDQSPDAVRSDPEVARAAAEAGATRNLSDAQLCELASRLRQSIAVASGERATAEAAARRLFYRGVAAGEAREFQEAAVYFECSNVVCPNRSSRYNLAVVRMETHQWVDALRAFDNYLVQAPNVAADPTVQQARQAIEAEPYAEDARAMELFDRLRWAIDRVSD
jgi:tetratricopeptide (TPR) repeat protein